MTDIASLAFAIDSSDARRAKTDLDAMRGSSADAAEQALRLTRAFVDGKDPLSVYRAELALMDQQMRQAGQGIDVLVDRMNRLTITINGLQGPTRELRQTVGQLDAAAAAFGTTSSAMEAFVRGSRAIGLSSQETTSALQRIQMALQGVSEEGQRARQTLANYGVSLDGRGSGDAAAVLREFTERLRQYRMDPAMGGDIQAVLGPMSISSIAALRDPDFRSVAQRERELRQDAEADRIAQLRRGVVQRTRQNELRQNELDELEREYSTGGDRAWSVLTFGMSDLLQGPAARRRELEARRDAGAQSRSAYERSNAYLVDPVRYYGPAVGGLMSGYRVAERSFEWLGSDEFDLQQAEISARYAEEAAQAETLFGGIGARGRALWRRAQSAAGRYDSVMPAEALQVNQRTEGALLSADQENFRSSLSAAQRARQQRYMEAARNFGVDLTDPAAARRLGDGITNPDLMTPEQIAARFSEGQRGALGATERALFNSQYMERFRGIADSSRVDLLARRGLGWNPYGVDPTGGSGGTEQEAERSRRVAQAIVSAERDITDAYSRGARIRMEVAEIDRQITEQRARTSEAVDRQARELRTETRLIEQSLGLGGTEDAAAALRRRAAQAASERPGGASVGSLLTEGFAREEASAQRQYLQMRRQNEANLFRINMMQGGADSLQISDAERVHELTRGMREQAEAIGREYGRQSEQYRESVRALEQMEQKHRTLLELNRQTTQELTRQQEVRRIANTLTETFIAAGDATEGERVGRERRFAAAMRLTQRGENEEEADYRQRVRDLLARDPDFARTVDASIRADVGAADERNRLASRNALALARAGGSGDPLADREAQRRVRRQQIVESYEPGIDDVARDRALAQFDAQFDRETRSMQNTPLVQNQQAAEQAAARLRAMNRAGLPSITDTDLRRFAQTIAAEAGTAEGRQAVGNVIMNRARMTGQGLGDVVMAPGQFEVWRDGSAQRVNLNSASGREALRIAEALLSGELGDITGGADHFYSPRGQAARGRAAPAWAAGRQGTDIGGNVFFRLGSTPQANYRAQFGVEGELAAAGARYGQATGGDAAAYELSQATAMAAEALVRFAQQAAATGNAIAEVEGQIGRTPFERGMAQAMASVRPETERARSIADRLEASNPMRAAELRAGATQREEEARRLYIANLQLRRSDERQSIEDEIADQSFMVGYFGSSTGMQRELGMRQRRRTLQRTHTYLSEEEINQDVERYGALYELREQNRIMGMLRDSWYQLGNSAGQALERIIMQGGKATDVLKALLAEMASYHIRAGTRELGMGFQNLLGSGLSWLFGTGSTGAAAGATSIGVGAGGAVTGSMTVGGNLFTFATGGILDRGFYTPMAQGGGIYSHAQYVPMAGGGTALVGEAGPEAAVPLVRMPSGNLGVRSQGGGGPAISNTFNVTVQGGGGGGSPGANQRFGTDVARQLEGMVTAVIVRNLTPGGVLSHSGQPVMR